MDKEYVLKVLKEIMDIDSPSGYCGAVADKTTDILTKTGYSVKKSNKGGLEVDVRGASSERKVGVSAHLDTLGAFVRSVNGKGWIKFSTIGGLNLATSDGEYCRVHTRDGKVFTGTFVSEKASSHVFREAHTQVREAANMYIRLDEKIKTAQDVYDLGIQSGDFIAVEPKLTVTDSGFIKSRFLDDKVCVALSFAALKELSDKKLKPKFDTKFIFTVYEEIGHGGSGYGEGLNEVLALDMGCIGDDLKGTEYDVSICAADTGGPYDYEFTTRLIGLAKKHKLGYAVDVYPFYGSDVSAMIRAGRDIKGGLIGPGIHASHGMERTHMDALKNTYDLIMAYLLD